MRGGLKGITSSYWDEDAHASCFDAVGKRLAPFGVDVFHSNIHERWKEACADGSFQWLEVFCNVRADAGDVLSFTLQAKCKSCIGSLWVIHSHFGQ